MDDHASNLNRRSLLCGGSALLGTSLIAAPLAGWTARQADAGPLSPVDGPFGPVAPVADHSTGLPLLQLPSGFQYTSFSWTGDLMSDGQPVPARHDGMAVVLNRRRELTLIRNHENSLGPTIQGGGIYDPVLVPGALVGAEGLLPLSGGTTRLVYRGRRWVRDEGSLGGTVANCAGGPTPWGSWLSCEETMVDVAPVGGKKHGFVFEVPGDGVSSAVPIIDMGWMSHEAVAVDPATGIVYLTEDNGPNSGLYRFLPADNSQRIGSLEAGGVLQMARVVSQTNADLRDPAQGAVFDIDWVTIDEPLRQPELAAPDGIFFGGKSGPFLSGEEQGAATFARLEGAWAADGLIYFTDTSAGAAGEGVVWAYRPSEDREGGGQLTALFVSQTRVAGNNPDNITVSPDGTILFCEDGGGEALRLMGVTPQGESYVFGVNNVMLEEADLTRISRTEIAPGDYTGREWAGATFSPDGNTLFVNIQTPGITFAITGPFALARLRLGRGGRG